MAAGTGQKYNIRKQRKGAFWEDRYHATANEIQDPPRRYRTIDLDNLVRLLGFTDLQDLQSSHKRWIEASLRMDESGRESHWTESIASGSKSFIEEVKKALDSK